MIPATINAASVWQRLPNRTRKSLNNDEKITPSSTVLRDSLEFVEDFSGQIVVKDLVRRLEAFRRRLFDERLLSVQRHSEEVSNVQAIGK
jgi:hypothetical protein